MLNSENLGNPKTDKVIFRGSLIDNKGEISFWNPAAERIFGYNSAEVMGKNAHELLAPPEYHAAFRVAFKDFTVSGRGNALGKTTELVARRKNSEEFHIALSLDSFQKDGHWHAAGIVRDITEQKLLAVALERQHNLTQMYLDIAGVLLVALNTEGQITMINRKGCEVTGYGDNEIIGRNWFDVCLPGELREEVKGVFDKLMAGDIAPVEYYENPVLTRDGEQRIVAFHNAVLYDSSHSIVGILFSGEDITERKLAEQEKQKLIEDLQKALSEVKKLSGFLPICASCKKIRDDEGYWSEIERYIGEHTDAQFSHGICPDCMRKLYPEYADEVLNRLEKDDKE